MDEEIFAFGSFRLVPAQRMLSENGKPLRLGSRALDILVALVERPGETISKEELIARAWPDTVVEEAALRVHVAALRKALGDGRAGKRYIANHPGRGYAFVAPVTRESAFLATAVPNEADVARNLPALLTRVVGRDEIILALTTQLARHRFMTIVGPGGIGKTTVAVAVADRARASYKDGVWFVELASLSDPYLISSAVVAVLGIPQSGVSPVSAITASLRKKHALIVLDSCEHVVAEAANIGEEILRAAPSVSILATSREPLRAEGEWVHRLASLEVPPHSADLTTNNILNYPAVELFTERAAAIVEGLSFGAAELAAVVEICRTLDGMPLALELAAAQVDVFGIKGLAGRLDNRFTILTKGRRTALSRHQTLRATMDWSYGLLPQAEQLILGRLSVFQGDFTIDAAAAVAADDQIEVADVFEGVANLGTKSLVATDISGKITYYHLLDTTRAYALEKLTESGEVERVRRLHAEYFRDLFEQAEVELETRSTAEWLADYRHQIHNVRAALDWAFSSVGDLAIGIGLTVAVIPLWLQLSLVDECRGRVERGLARLAGQSKPAARQEMKLYAALGGSLLFTKGPTAETEAAWTKALEISQDLDDAEYQLRSLWGLWVHHMNSGDFGAALRLAESFHKLALARGNPTDLPIAERLIGTSFHYRGDQTDARRHIEHMLAHYVPPIRRSPSARFFYDQKVVARVALARILWLQGFPDQAWRTAQSTVDDASALNNPVSLCFTLAEAGCPVALFIGDLATAERCIATLLDSSAAHALPIWQSWGHRFYGTLLIWNGDLERGLGLLRTSLERPPEASFQPRFTWFLGQLAEGFGRAGQIAQGLATIDEALARSERNQDRWCLAELVRIKGVLLAEREPPNAEDHFARSLDWARQQRALSWELRTATSLARLLHGQRRTADARTLLGSIYSRFTEGFATSDLREARTLLERLA
jgi:predicted ATPase/DNA-binding winged helix-turn-helix (wHTH) protein